jgi:hypothetical protein
MRYFSSRLCKMTRWNEEWRKADRRDKNTYPPWRRRRRRRLLLSSFASRHAICALALETVVDLIRHVLIHLFAEGKKQNAKSRTTMLRLQTVDVDPFEGSSRTQELAVMKAGHGRHGIGVRSSKRGRTDGDDGLTLTVLTGIELLDEKKIEQVSQLQGSERFSY